MFRKLPMILTAEKLVDRSMHKSQKIHIHDRNSAYRNKKTVIARTEAFVSYIVITLGGYVKDFPSIEQLPSFYREFIEIEIDAGKLKHSLGAVDWARKTCQSIYGKQRRDLKKSGNVDFLKQKQKEIYGRIVSVVTQIDKHLVFLGNVNNILKDLPEILDIPTVVIAGYPNVGKSSLLRCLSAAKPQIASYPFTTKEIYVGHIEKIERHKKTQYQVIDTPGLLDRPIAQRNNMEKQALAALAHLADVIVFITDPSETCGYSLRDQLHLLSQIQELFCDIPVIIVENKTDIVAPDSPHIKISCKTRDGIDLLLQKIFTIVKASEQNKQ